MPLKTLRAFVVQRVGWEYNDEYYDRRDDHSEPVKTFLDRAKAEAYRRDKERAERKKSPWGLYQFGGHEDVRRKTSLDFDALRAKLRELGLDPPGDPERYVSWYYEIEGGLTDEQREGLWDLFDQARFFEVVETTIELEE